jgi:hypothetical protein
MRSITIASNVSGVESSDCLCHDKVDDDDLAKRWWPSPSSGPPRRVPDRIDRRKPRAYWRQSHGGCEENNWNFASCPAASRLAPQTVDEHLRLWISSVDSIEPDADSGAVEDKAHDRFRRANEHSRRQSSKPRRYHRGWRAPLPRRKSTNPPANSCGREVTLPISNCSPN